MKTTHIIIFLSILLSAASCKTKKIVSEKSMDKEKIYGLRLGGCYGTCPVYTLSIYSNGEAEFEGEYYTDKHGLYGKQLSKATMSALKDAFGKVDFFALQDKYKSRIPDLTQVTLFHAKDGKSKTVKYKEERPDELPVLEKMLKEIAESKGWKAIKPAPSSSMNDNKPRSLNDESLTLKKDDDSQQDLTRLLVTFSDKAFLPGWIKNMKPFGFNILKKDTQLKNTYELTYDTSKSSPSQVMDILNSDSHVKKASFVKIKSNEAEE